MKEKSMTTKKKKLPKFKSEYAEQKFWSKHDSTDYIDWTKAQRVIFPNLKPSLKTISLRLPESMIDALKHIANKHDLPYQSLIKMFLKKDIEKELAAL